MDVEIHILGPLRIWAHGREVPAGDPKQRSLLTLLAHQAPGVVPVETIVEQLWPDARYQVRTSVLHPLISHTRRRLAEGGLPDAVPREHGGYRLAVAAEAIDLHRFRRSADRARAAAAEERHGDVIELLNAALSWWPEQPLADLRSPWADWRRHVLAGEVLNAYTTLFDAQLAVGDHHAVLARLPDLLDHHDSDERLAAQWIRALAADGRRAEAARFYGNFRHRLIRELDAEPSAELNAVYRHVISSPPSDDAATTLVPQASPPRQLPAPPPDLPGRDKQLATLNRLANERRTSGGIIVLSGLPGIGKTQMALYWAHQHLDQYGDGQIFLPLSTHASGPAMDPDAGLAIMLESVGLPADRLPADRERRRRRLADLLAHRRILVVLDDVVDPTQARTLVVSAPGCLFLITSRSQLQPLIVEDGAGSVPVPPLEAGAGIGVLRRILGDHAPHETLRAAAQAAGGIPLALHIVGNYLAARPHVAVAEQISELRQQLLGPQSDDATTMRGAFTLSDQQLPSAPQSLLYRLALHPGARIDSGAAAALADTDVDSAARALTVLTHRCLITPISADHYTLHDIVREYAYLRVQETHTSDQIRAARHRMLDYYLATVARAARLTTPDEAPLLDIATAIPPRPLATDTEALVWCDAQRATLLALTAFAAEHGFHQYAWQLPGAYCRLLDRFGRYTDLIRAHTIAVDGAVADGHPEALATSVTNLGVTYLRLHHYQHAGVCLRHALRLANEIHNPALIAGCQHNLGVTSLYQAQIPAAIDMFKAVRDTSRTHGNQPGEAFALHRLGHAHRLLGHLDQAAIYLREALTIRQRLDTPREQAATLAELAALHLDTGTTYAALTCCIQALELENQAGDRAAECDTLITIAHVHHVLGEYDTALREARRALDLSSRQADSYQRARAMTMLADALAATDHPHQADQARHEAHIIQQDLDLSHPPISDLPGIVLSTSRDTIHGHGQS